MVWMHVNSADKVRVPNVSVTKSSMESRNKETSYLEA
uniref:Uncharacterized protein n=1 Tax=Arundo donax TaxID=35708 RepID=A0A0A8Y202_ARUDO